MLILFRCLFILLISSLAACSSIRTDISSTPVADASSYSNYDLTQLQISRLTKAIDKTRIVLVGETHTNYGHHLNQLAIIKAIHKKQGGVISGMSIGLEMIQQPFQVYLDDYVAGSITEIEMLKGVEWYSRWRFDFRLYQPIFDYAKQNKIPLIALNIPTEITKRISKVGIQGLNSNERKLLPLIIDKSNLAYRENLRKIFGLHLHGTKFNENGFNKFVDAQLAWDEGMAFTASNYLKKNTKTRMVILAGSGHLINRHGIPSRIDRQLALPMEQRSLVILSHDDKQYTSEEADFSLKARAIKLPSTGLIGIAMKDDEQGVKISAIVEAGAAEKAGLMEDDYLIQLNKIKVKTSSDVSLWRLDKKPNEKVDVLIRRNNQLLKKTLILGN